MRKTLISTMTGIALLISGCGSTTIPANFKTVNHVVAEGETAWEIAEAVNKKHADHPRDIREIVNDMKSLNGTTQYYPGQRIKVPFK